MKPMEFDEEKLSQTIKRLENAAQNESPKEMFKIVKELVPTFKHE